MSYTFWIYHRFVFYSQPRKPCTISTSFKDRALRICILQLSILTMYVAWKNLALSVLRSLPFCVECWVLCTKSWKITSIEELISIQRIGLDSLVQWFMSILWGILASAPTTFGCKQFLPNFAYTCHKWVRCQRPQSPSREIFNSPTVNTYG